MIGLADGGESSPDTGALGGGVQSAAIEEQERMQGKDEILIHAPLERVWALVADSDNLPKWRPPVLGVELLDKDRPERVGSRRRVDARFGGKQGFFVEHRTEHVAGRRIAYIIDEESFGLQRLLRRPGFVLAIEPLGPEQTHVVWSFHHQPHGLVGRLMNPFVRRNQRSNRRAALQSLRRYAEEGVERPNP